MNIKKINVEKTKLIRIVIIFLLAISCFKRNVNANYSIENMDIQATIQENGDLKVEQDITYKFNSEYNGIYVKIPYNLKDVEADNILVGNKLNDNLYSGNNVVLNDILVSTDNNYKSFEEISKK